MVERARENLQGSGGQSSGPLYWLARIGPGWLSAWAVVLALAVWLSRPASIWLGVAVLGSVGWSLSVVRRRGALRLAAALLLWTATGVAVGVHVRLAEIIGDWPALQLRIEERSAAALDEALARRLEDGEAAVDGATEAVEMFAESQPPSTFFTRVDQLQRRTGVSAIALFDVDGAPVAWAGEHRGTIPVEARRGTERYIFQEGPLFSYLYFVRPLPEGLTATAAFLLEASIEAGEGVVPFADRFQLRHGARPRFLRPERASCEVVWDWGTADTSILSVCFAELTQQDWWARVMENGRRGAASVALAALLLLSVVWYRSRIPARGVPVVVGTVALLAAPLNELVGAETYFSPLQFVLPGPLDITLPALLVLLIGGSLWLLGRAEGVPRRWIPVGVTALLLGALFPLVILLVDRSAASGLMAARVAGGFWVQLATVLLVGVPAFLILRSARALEIGSGRAWILRITGYVVPVILGLLILAWWRPERPIPFALATLWAVPAVLLLADPDRPGRGTGSLRSWLVAGWLAGTLALAFLWPLHVRAELARAEREVGLLGTQPDPFIDFLLREFAQQTRGLAEEGENGVNLLYHGWVASGLAREGYEALITLWRGGTPEAELNLTELSELPPSAAAAASVPRPSPAVMHYGGIEGLHYLLAAPLDEDRAVSVAIPPRQNLTPATPIARFLHPERAVRDELRGETLYLVPIDTTATPVAHAGLAASTDTVHWVQTTQGWRSETVVEMPEGPVHAHLLLDTPGMPLLLTRAILALTAILGVLFGLWLTARLIQHGLVAVPYLRIHWLRSFRGRLSVALFVFFLLPTLVFGAVSYGAVAREVVRSAAAMAQQALEQAADRLPQGPLAELRSTIPTDLLLYRGGTLAGASAPEVIELGLFHTWLPPAVYLQFAGGEDVQELEERRLAGRDYLVAYRRLDASSVLAAPIPLASNEITRRRQEFRDLALLVILFGFSLSIVLALLVGRALARPLDELSRAAVTVGGGDLQTRLPESRVDEFGSVYSSFNRMVERLLRTRTALVQETRRTETIVAEAATGMLALDAHGRIELINPMAAEILGIEFEAGDPIGGTERQDGTLAATIAELLECPSNEASTELDVEGRMIRMKLRRLPGDNGGGGAVVALEDVTAEVRTARVLAWGEMARQVAHEIKNPLTPIKLAVQHVQRAFIDQRADFGDILDRNVEAVLREIDRLGDISRAFSRFGSPAHSDSPIEAVDVSIAIDEVLALYRGSEGGVSFRADFRRPDFPLVTARTDELKEVLVNLLENAREAVGEGGEVTVSVDLHSPTESVVIAVTDTGVGIPREELPRIFEPHFSTRSSGTGLGLPIVRRIVDSWGGQIRAESTLGVGTTVELTLTKENSREVDHD